MCGESLQTFALFLTLCKITKMCLKGSKTDIFLDFDGKKYEGFNMVTVEVKQTEIILDLLSNGFKSSNSILQQSGNSNLLYQ